MRWGVGVQAYAIKAATQWMVRRRHEVDVEPVGQGLGVGVGEGA
eukprot:COSAG04_NODE_30929_length_260_cov_0.267081_1_plen_43_part_01